MAKEPEIIPMPVSHLFVAGAAMLAAAGLFLTVLSWTGPAPRDVGPEAMAMMRYGAPIVSIVLILGIVAFLCLRKDKITNYLSRVTRSYFERAGFCFAIVPQTAPEQFVLQLFYQNRYERRCDVTVQLVSLGKGRSKLSQEIALSCEGGEFGVVSCPTPVPKDFCGSKHSWLVFCAPVYPDGKGRTLFFREGKTVGLPTTDSEDAVNAVASAFVGGIGMPIKATFSMTLPDEIFEMLPKDSTEVRKVIWRPGEPEIIRVDLSGEQDSTRR